jgi:hypothetical protein
MDARMKLTCSSVRSVEIGNSVLWQETFYENVYYIFVSDTSYVPHGASLTQIGQHSGCAECKRKEPAQSQSGRRCNTARASTSNLGEIKNSSSNALLEQFCTHTLPRHVVMEHWVPRLRGRLQLDQLVVTVTTIVRPVGDHSFLVAAERAVARS